MEAKWINTETGRLSAKVRVEHTVGLEELAAAVAKAVEAKSSWTPYGDGDSAEVAVALLDADDVEQELRYQLMFNPVVVTEGYAFDNDFPYEVAMAAAKRLFPSFVPKEG